MKKLAFAIGCMACIVTVSCTADDLTHPENTMSKKENTTLNPQENTSLDNSTDTDRGDKDKDKAQG